MTKRVRVMVRGRVQGVGYRHFAMKRAAGLGLTGCVRNLPNGDVEVVGEGDQEKLEKFVELLKQGPSGADVRDVVLVWLPATGEFREFGVSF
ncbi:MAG: acylphosphatase [Armatimonadetes bacterium]|nr:acylphosphatase [Armatimonadota bacterium]